MEKGITEPGVMAEPSENDVPGTTIESGSTESKGAASAAANSVRDVAGTRAHRS